MRVVVSVPREFMAWQEGFAHLPQNMGLEGATVWELASEVFFDRTQEFVHVVTGRLKRSGRRLPVEVSGGQLTSGVEYTAPYAEIEFGRGGDHDAIQRAWVASQELFDAAFPLMWEKVVSSWR